MIDVEQALQQVISHCSPLAESRCSLDEALDRVLAQPVISDVDSPPHDKALMDGFAIRAGDFQGPGTRLAVLEQIAAGAVPTRPVTEQSASQIMTGAPLPDGADAVVMVEQTTLDEPGTSVTINAEQVAADQNIMRRGASLREGEVILEAGRRLRAIDMGLLSEVGCAEVSVIPPPTVAVLSTGNELVPADQVPGVGQIRNSNGPLLAAMVDRAGGRAMNLGIARDDPGQLREKIQRGLEQDVLVLSGGVSAGVLDLVPQTLAELGVEQVFHKVRIKPGKPIWFGRLSGARDSLVFGLPGNPVSSLVCFELFVATAIRALSGRRQPLPAQSQGRLTSDFQHRGDRPTYHPARRSHDDGRPQIQPLPWKGSADQRGLVPANCLCLFPAGNQRYVAGETVTVVELEAGR